MLSAANRLPSGDIEMMRVPSTLTGCSWVTCHTAAGTAVPDGIDDPEGANDADGAADSPGDAATAGASPIPTTANASTTPMSAPPRVGTAGAAERAEPRDMAL